MALATASDTPAYLSVRDLGKRFGDFEALRGVSLDVRQGEFVCFLGPSGCGKTTLLRAIAGLDPQTSGTIRQGGVDVSLLPPARRDFGIVFQSYALFPNLNVAANVGYGLVGRKASRADIAARVGELLTLVGLPNSGAKYPAHSHFGPEQVYIISGDLSIGDVRLEAGSAAGVGTGKHENDGGRYGHGGVGRGCVSN